MYFQLLTVYNIFVSILIKFYFFPHNIDILCKSVGSMEAETGRSVSSRPAWYFKSQRGKYNHYDESPATLLPCSLLNPNETFAIGLALFCYKLSCFKKL